MFSRSGYRALPLGDFDRFQQSSLGIYGSKQGFFPNILGRDRLSLGQDVDSPQSWPSYICHSIISFLVFLLLIVTFPISGWFALKIVPTYERMVVFRLGRIRAPQGPGMVLLLPFIDSWQRVDLRTRAFNVPPCKLTSKDGALVSVGADVQFRIWDPVLSVMMVKDLNSATRMTAQNAMTKTLLKKQLREIQMEKLKIGDQLLLEINDMTKSWGLEVDRVELTVEAVLQAPQDAPSLPGLDSAIQQLALHFFGSGSGGHAPVAAETDTMEMVNEVEGSLPPANNPSSSSNGSAKKRLTVEELLAAVGLFLSEALVSQVQACYQLNILLPNSVPGIYFIDLTTGSGKIGHGVPECSPDVVLEMTEADLLALFSGELKPLGAYMSGRLKVKGDLNQAMKLELLLRAME
ncbi:stomatin-like protein 1 isoform X2 [Petaurus breviceps papuanus]|uniref:stomatin-like protein 1 isoform X2 n=1 Tax=Petaurus breviceps papuanus TaxID=3040969 RepID=UPI0036DE406A